ncbi:hypothetical protein ID866_5793 [Astraeus odoratus]|nr:hypothetical protein ID866_5793 [Astraeus odoratus]
MLPGNVCYISTEVDRAFQGTRRAKTPPIGGHTGGGNVHPPQGGLRDRSKTAWSHNWGLAERQALLQLEYIVNEEYTKDVLSKDHEFGFERGVATILNLSYLIPLSNGKFFKDLHMMVSGGIIPRMDQFIEQIFPIFERQAKEVVHESQQSQAGVDLFEHSRRCIAEAMIVVGFGQDHVNEHNIKIAEEVADAIATVTGIYQNTSPFARTFPKTWKVITWVKMMFGLMAFKYFPMTLPIIWKEVRGRKYRPLNSGMLEQIEEEDGNREPLLHYAARMYTNSEGAISLPSVLWLSVVMLAFIFASVHQTAGVAVWVMYELSLRKEYIPVIREELSIIADSIDKTGVHRLSYEALRRATFLDAFTREVLRLKGDTLSLFRVTTGDVSLGGYTIPEGVAAVPLLARQNLTSSSVNYQ